MPYAPLIAALVAVTASSAAAQGALDYDPDIVHNCLENAETFVDQRSCIGRGAQACIEGEAGQSTVGLGYCYSAEWEDWDGRLNAVYRRLLIQ